MFFLPRYTGRGEAWRQAIADRLSLGPISSVVDEEAVELVVGTLRLLVDSDGKVTVGPTETVDDGPWSLDVLWKDSEEYGYGTVGDIFKALGSSKLVELYKTDAGRVRDALQRLPLLTYGSLVNIATYWGASLRARPLSPTASFVEIFEDQVRYYDLCEEHEDTAIGPKGERLFSLHIVPPTHATSQTKTSSTAKIERECRGWLTQEMSQSRKEPTMTKTFAWKIAKDRWDHLSKKAFDRAWAAAAIGADAPAWAKSGRRPSR